MTPKRGPFTPFITTLALPCPKFEAPESGWQALLSSDRIVQIDERSHRKLMAKKKKRQAEPTHVEPAVVAVEETTTEEAAPEELSVEEQAAEEEPAEEQAAEEEPAEEQSAQEEPAEEQAAEEEPAEEQAAEEEASDEEVTLEKRPPLASDEEGGEQADAA